jgi:hypothetical protein
MSPAGTFSERSPTPVSSLAISPIPALLLLVEAAHADENILTPPQSPDNWNFKEVDVVKAGTPSLCFILIADTCPERRCLPASLKFILN